MTPAPAPEQCVILVDEAGETHPLAMAGDRPFLAYHLWHARRFGFKRVLLLAADPSAALAEFAADERWSRGLSVGIAPYAASLGTAGALHSAMDRLDDRFLLLDGAVLFDFNWLDLCDLSNAHPASLIGMALQGPAEADGGVYLARRAVATACPERGSFKHDVLPALAGDGRLVSRPQQGLFVGAGEAARLGLPASLRRGAVFFDRDGVLNVDHGYTYRWEDFHWIDGAVEAVKAVNDRGLFAFLITNQSGVARGYYDEPAIHALHGRMQEALRARGAHLDDIRYCPHHPQATLARYMSDCDWRKPGPGMILDLAAHWPVEMGRSGLIGDKSSDLEAAAAAGIASSLFKSGRLDRAVLSLLSDIAAPAPTAKAP